jgi:hypothetical protein
MKVYVLTKDDNWDCAEIIGVFKTIEKAKEFAEKEEPDKNFRWEQDKLAPQNVTSDLSKGLANSYGIAEFEMIDD